MERWNEGAREGHQALELHLRKEEEVLFPTLQCLLLEDHEKKEDRLLIDVLGFSLKPEELKELARSFQRAAWKLHEEMS